MYQESIYSGKLKNTDLDIVFLNDENDPNYPEYIVWLMGNGTLESVTCFSEEIEAYNASIQRDYIKTFMQQKKCDGYAYYNEMDLDITTALAAVDRDVLFPKLQQIDTLLYPPLTKIKSGDFASALFIFLNQDPPTDIFVLQFYNQAYLYCQTYYDTKYPK